MDVPFLSSGAVNRQHYVLVRKVEESSTPQAADDLLHNQVQVIRGQLDTRTQLPLVCLSDA
jgi:AP-4 complex subunit epsilon-1